MNAKGMTFHVLLFQDKLYNSDVLKGVMSSKKNEYMYCILSRQYQFMDGIFRQ